MPPITAVIGLPYTLFLAAVEVFCSGTILLILAIVRRRERIPSR